MSQLDKRVSKLGKIMAERPPNLAGVSIERLAKMLAGSINNPVRTDLLLCAMSGEQLGELYAAGLEELRRCRYRILHPRWHEEKDQVS
jgi:hypothetical protein